MPDRHTWATESAGATAGFLEFTGQSLETLERAVDRDELLLAVLGFRVTQCRRTLLAEQGWLFHTRPMRPMPFLLAAALEAAGQVL